MTGSQIQGNINSKGQVKFDRDSLILGNIAAQYLDMNGKVKGNIDINGKAEFKSDAYIIGDINVSTLTVLEGATISGHVNTSFLQDTPTNVFPEMIAVSDIG
jgi:cytoskeletal protein CcmA (bactofilin family)